MTEPALALTFVDHERDLYATARSGFALRFDEGGASSYDEPTAIEPTPDGWHAQLPGELELDLTRIAEPVDLAGMRTSLCSDGASGLAVIAEINDPPRWQELDATRYICVLIDRDHAAVAFARRPSGALGHGDELVVAQLWSDGDSKSVETARLSTIYDGEGRPRQASLELWLPGEDFPRRAFGKVTAGASLALEGLDVHAAAMNWRMEGIEGGGVYELTVREQTPAAA